MSSLKPALATSGDLCTVVTVYGETSRGITGILNPKLVNWSFSHCRRRFRTKWLGVTVTASLRLGRSCHVSTADIPQLTDVSYLGSYCQSIVRNGEAVATFEIYNSHYFFIRRIKGSDC